MNDYVSNLSDLNLILLIIAVTLAVLQLFLLIGWAIRGQGVTLLYGIAAVAIGAYLVVATR